MKRIRSGFKSFQLKFWKRNGNQIFQFTDSIEHWGICESLFSLSWPRPWRGVPFPLLPLICWPAMVLSLWWRFFPLIVQFRCFGWLLLHINVMLKYLTECNGKALMYTSHAVQGAGRASGFRSQDHFHTSAKLLCWVMGPIPVAYFPPTSSPQSSTDLEIELYHH